MLPDLVFIPMQPPLNRRRVQHLLNSIRHISFNVKSKVCSCFQKGRKNTEHKDHGGMYLKETDYINQSKQCTVAKCNVIYVVVLEDVTHLLTFARRSHL